MAKHTLFQYKNQVQLPAPTPGNSKLPVTLAPVDLMLTFIFLTCVHTFKLKI